MKLICPRRSGIHDRIALGRLAIIASQQGRDVPIDGYTLPRLLQNKTSARGFACGWTPFQVIFRRGLYIVREGVGHSLDLSRLKLLDRNSLLPIIRTTARGVSGENPGLER